METFVKLKWRRVKKQLSIYMEKILSFPRLKK